MNRATQQRLETQPWRASATREHTTKHDPGEAGNERGEKYPFAYHARRRTSGLHQRQQF
jgi:hypothetical protein